MKKKTTAKPTAGKFSLLRQICNFIPEFLVARIARETQASEKASTFSPWSHVVSLLYAQLTHSIGLNDVCDALRLQSGPLSSTRAKDNLQFKVAHRHQLGTLGKTLRDDLIHLQTPTSRQEYPGLFTPGLGIVHC